MKVEFEPKTGESISPVSSDYSVFESLKYPVSIIGTDGITIYGNEAYNRFFNSGTSEIRLDWEHPFFPEYRKRIAQSYLSALNGNEKHCFAIINSPDGSQMPVEIYLFPMVQNNSVSSILALMIIVDDRLLSFDRSTLSIISEENFQYDNLHFEFSPMPIVRIDEDLQIIKCSHSLEGFLGYSSEEILLEKSVSFDSLFLFDFDKIRKSAMDILSGNLSFQRIGEVKIRSRNDEIKVANIVLYPIVQNQEISSIEIIMEDLTRIRELKNTVNTLSRIQLFSDITKGFLHTLNNTINVIMSKTQLMMQITEKESVLNGIKLIEESAFNMVDQIKRIQNFIGYKDDQDNETSEPLVNIIEDAIEFSKMQFKVDSKDNKKIINIDKKYFTDISVSTDTRLLREIITSTILKVANFVRKRGVINITLKQSNNLHLLVEIKKEDPPPGNTPVLPSFVNVFSGIDIRQAAEKINLKILEEESSGSYAIKAIFPSKIIMESTVDDTDDQVYKLRDLDIIVAEDEMALQKILYELFDRMGNRVFICENGRDALEEFKKNHYDLVITDYGLSGMTGIELSARIKEINEKTATILLSGWMLDDIKMYKNVVDLFIPKPFKLDVLLKQVSKLLAGKKNTD